MSESKNKTGIKTKRNVVAAEKKTATAVKKAAENGEIQDVPLL